MAQSCVITKKRPVGLDRGFHSVPLLIHRIRLDSNFSSAQDAGRYYQGQRRLTLYEI